MGGLATAYEDFLDKHGSVSQDRQRYYGYIAVRHKQGRSGTTKRPTLAAKPKQWSAAERQQVIDQVREYLTNDNNARSAAEAVVLYGNPFDHPRKLIRAFREYYHSNLGVAHSRGNKSDQHMSRVEELHRILSSLPNTLSDPQQTHEIVKNVEGALSHFFSANPEYGPISLDAMLSMTRQSEHICKRILQLKEELEVFQDDASNLKGFDNDFLDVSQALTDLSVIHSRLEADFTDAGRLERLNADIQNQWKQFIHLHSIYRRPQRPPIAELNRLYLNQDQETFVSSDHAGHRRIQGASGSGKTIILIHRAIRLALEDRGNIVRIFTINQVLADLIQSTAVNVYGAELPSNLYIHCYTKFLVQCLSLFEDTAGYRSVDSIIEKRNGKEYAIKWCEYFGGNGHPPHQILRTDPPQAKGGKVSGSPGKSLIDAVRTYCKRENDDLSHTATSRYLRDEMRFIQSGFLPRDRPEYLESEVNGRRTREGRSVPLYREQRKMCLTALVLWEKWLEKRRLWDHETIATKVSKYFLEDDSVGKIRNSFPAKHLLFDECQDLSTIDLMISRRLVEDPDEANRFFFVGDLNQRVQIRHQHYPSAGFPLGGRSKNILEHNYRNTKQILTAAVEVIKSYPPLLSEAAELSTPKASPFEGDRPQTFRCSTANHVTLVCGLVRRALGERRRVGVVSNNEFILKALYDNLGMGIFLTRNGDNADVLTRLRKPVISPLVLARLETVKGHEFDTVIAVDVSEGVTPYPSVPKSDYWREANALYCALTRAREQLYITYVDKPSVLLRSMMSLVDHVDPSDDQALMDLLQRQVIQ